ncbi:MAG: type II/IV secretion system ATPase subunit [Candidatus Nanohaloarchaeota archaeon QJJ-5]|nr:type II/IV secretion system ATPase subunit [Candidatus Nanohaloarchaeota archaeon QJJ-5]
MYEEYRVTADTVPAKVKITSQTDDYVPRYFIKRPQIDDATEALMTQVRDRILTEVEVSKEEFVDSSELEHVKERFRAKANEIIEEVLPDIDPESQAILVGNLLHDMLGLGDLELLLHDENLEEMVVNSADEPVWAYHKEYGWLKTDLVMESEEQIQNYASMIGRRVGKQISNLNPLLDAHLTTGDRTNATIKPISTQGNTITIRKFARDPWTITDFIENKTINPEVAALLWICIQYEMNIIVSGGTGAGKTSMLGVLMPFIPSNNRIVSIEDTREIRLPEFLHWVPLTTREPNPEGKGGVSMNDLLVNSLRMRPDRIIVGEIRREKQAEVLFEAMHTGHSVYSTLHAETAAQTIRRLVNPPINVPQTLVEAIDLNVVMFRDRRRNIRRAMQVSEVVTDYMGGDAEMEPNTLYKWHARDDEVKKKEESREVFDRLNLHAGLTKGEIKQSIQDRKAILNWMVDHQINDVDQVGKVIAEFYQEEGAVIDRVKDDAEPDEVLDL